ncbi:hypothetical protein [Coleofasciculus sp. FACHB-1120]|nr:hypothetical protein [Coleofasciculus sp. FACHB-1120]
MERKATADLTADVKSAVVAKNKVNRKESNWSDRILLNLKERSHP